MKLLPYITAIIFLASFTKATSQTTTIDYANPKEYTLGGIIVDGAINYDSEIIIQLSGLVRGSQITVPSEDFSKAVRKLYDNQTFNDVKIFANKVSGNTMFLTIKVTERPRLSKYSFKGATKSQSEELKDKINLYRGKIMTNNLFSNIEVQCKNYFVEKGYLNTKVNIETSIDTSFNNGEVVKIIIDKGERVKIREIVFNGNEKISDKKLKKAFKENKPKRWFRFWKRSKYIEEAYLEEKDNILAIYNRNAFRDAEILSDNVTKNDDNTVSIEINIDEGNKYYFRDINWYGNTKFRTGQLDTILGINKGDEYSKSLLDERLLGSPSGLDVSALYMDQGYLFFQLNTTEQNVENDSIDLEIQIYEGKIARVGGVTLVGNIKTFDRVLMREIRTRPGDVFNRSEIIRTQREFSQLPYINPEGLNVVPKPNPVDGTVDIEYQVEEKASDQIELSAGWGGGQFIGTIGLGFNNFSFRNLFNKSAYTPLPSGDGQRLSFRMQANQFIQSFNVSFTEPWLGGKKPQALSVSMYKTLRGDITRRKEPTASIFDVTGIGIGLSQRLKVPDDFFSLLIQANYEYYSLKNQQSQQLIEGIDNGFINNLNLQFVLSRSSIDQLIYPRSGSKTSLTFKSTFPFSWFKDEAFYTDRTEAERYKWLEYNKIKFTTAWYTPLSKNKKLVLYNKVGFGFLNPWSKKTGISPFERFYLGGSAFGNFTLAGSEFVGLRGYGTNDAVVSESTGDRIISKYTMELRYPISLNPQITAWVTAFAEAGNSWGNFKEYNPFNVKRSAGIGLRLFMPMFSLISLDYGWGFDQLDPGAAGANSFDNQTRGTKPVGIFQFTIGMNIGEL